MARLGLGAALGALAFLRLYAAFGTTTVVTWDDRNYRRAALFDANRSDPVGAALAVALPERRTLFEGWTTAGYHRWLVLARTMSRSLHPDDTFQIVNLLSFAAQLVLVFFAFSRAGPLAGTAATVLYASMPIVFGLNRWVMTENHVMLAMLAISFAGAWLATSERRGTALEITRAVLAALVFGALSSTREYALPTFFVIALAALVALGITRRFVAASAFLATLVPYLAAFNETLRSLASNAAFKLTQAEYGHSLPELAVHAVRHVVGVPQAILLVAGVAFTGASVYRRVRAHRREQLPLLLMIAAHGVLFVVYAALLVASSNRTARGLVPLIWTAIPLVALGLRLETPELPRAAQLFSAAVALSLCTLGYDLVIAHREREWAHHPYALEKYNHPLFLRDLVSPDDMHVLQLPRPGAPR